MPRLQADPVAPIPYGGAHSWDEVAYEMEDAVLGFLGRTDHAIAPAAGRHVQPDGPRRSTLT